MLLCVLSASPSVSSRIMGLICKLCRIFRKKQFAKEFDNEGVGAGIGLHTLYLGL